MKDIREMVERYESIIKAYTQAEEKEDTAGMKTAREDMDALMKEVESGDVTDVSMFRLLSDAKNAGNDRIDLSLPSDYKNVKELVKQFKDYGFTEFTFSSTWSGAVETAYEFVKNGCILCGMVEINSMYKSAFSDEPEKKPAYLFKIDP